MKGILLIATALLTIASCTHPADSGDFSAQELALIKNADCNGTSAAKDHDNSGIPNGRLRVLTVCDSADLAILRTPSHNLSAKALNSEEYERLCSLMVATVTHPSQDGVGIAGPQVGLNRRVVAVQRFDKEPVMHAGRMDYPFEVYPNIRIVWASDSLTAGPEGCLSVPDRRGDVLRSTSIVIEYADMVFSTAQASCDSCCRISQSPENQGFTLNHLHHLPHAIQDKELRDSKLRDTIPTIRDTISGFTAVIFQHEIDHLDGILYIDRL